MSDSTIKRRRYFIRKTFQMQFVVRFAALIVIGALLSGVLLYVFSSSALDASFSSAHLNLRNTSELLVPYIILTHGVSVVLVVIAAFVLVIYLSHRIAGPLYRLEKSIAGIGAGDLSQDIHLRRNDQLKPMQDALQRMNDSLAERIAALQKDVVIIAERENDLVAAVDSSAGDETDKERLKTELSAALADLRKRLDEFTLPKKQSAPGGE